VGRRAESFSIQGRICSHLTTKAEESAAHEAAFVSQMKGWRSAKATADTFAIAAANAASSMSTWGASNIATKFQIDSVMLDVQMATARDEYDTFMRQQAEEKDIFMCLSEVDKLRAQFDVEKAQIVRRGTDLGDAKVEFVNALRATERAYAEGMSELDAERKRTVPSFAHSYWYQEKADRFLREFTWAKRLVYLAMRAVEYEFQQSLGLRKDILTATHPDQLEAAIRSMQTEVATRAINRRGQSLPR